MQSWLLELQVATLVLPSKHEVINNRSKELHHDEKENFKTQMKPMVLEMEAISFTIEKLESKEKKPHISFSPCPLEITCKSA
jgi:hypothetical protein